MLTPKDIHEKDFSKSFKGYDMEEVDLFLDQIIEDYDKIIRENRELASRIEALNTQIETYRGMENSLMHTMVSAHKAADDISDKAKLEAESVIEKANDERERILSEANERAQQIVNDKQSDIIETEARIRELNDILEEFKSGIIGYSDELLKLVNSFTSPDNAAEIIEYEPTEYEFTTLETDDDEEEEEEEEEDYSTNDYEQDDYPTQEFSSVDYTQDDDESDDEEYNLDAFANDNAFYQITDDGQLETVSSSDMEQVDVSKIMGQYYQGNTQDDAEDEETANYYSVQDEAYSEKPFTSRGQKPADQYFGPIDFDDDEVL